MPGNTRIKTIASNYEFFAIKRTINNKDSKGHRKQDNVTIADIFYQKLLKEKNVLKKLEFIKLHF